MRAPPPRPLAPPPAAPRPRRARARGARARPPPPPSAALGPRARPPRPPPSPRRTSLTPLPPPPPSRYKAFLEILHTYQKEQKTIKTVYEEARADTAPPPPRASPHTAPPPSPPLPSRSLAPPPPLQVSTLFKHHTDLLGEFSQFLPDGSPDSGGGLFGLGGKGKGKASLGMGAAPLKPMAQRPGMKPSNRAQEDADEERYWQKRKNARREAPGGGARDAQRSREAEFFTKCRQRMPKPLYLELLKCLNLFSFKILERSELLTLAHDLFKRSQPDLYQVFRSLLPGYAGGDNRALDDGGDDGRAARPPMADAAHYRELDFSAMKKHGTSYRILPDDYQKPTCSGRGPLEQLVLNDSWVSVASGSEDLNFKQMRKNQYEEAIFRAEDERFELDTSIDTNMACLNALLPVQAELATKPESEKRRLRLEHLMPEKQGLSAMHMRAIKRLYGAQGAQVIELLQKCPAAAINPLVKRLQQKDTEWRALRTSLVKGWKEVYEKNFTKALDHRSFYFKQGDKKNFSGKQMVLELKALADPEAGGEKDGEEKKEGGEAKAEAPGAGALALPFTIKGARCRCRSSTTTRWRSSSSPPS